VQLSYNDLCAKDVISLSDGKNLGRISDAVIRYPEYKIKGFFVKERKGFFWSRAEIYIPVSNIVKIGEDAILCNVDEKGDKGKDCKPACKPFCKPNDRRNYDEYE